MCQSCTVAPARLNTTEQASVPEPSQSGASTPAMHQASTRHLSAEVPESTEPYMQIHADTNPINLRQRCHRPVFASHVALNTCQQPAKHPDRTTSGMLQTVASAMYLQQRCHSQVCSVRSPLQILQPCVRTLHAVLALQRVVNCEHTETLARTLELGHPANTCACMGHTTHVMCDAKHVLCALSSSVHVHVHEAHK